MARFNLNDQEIERIMTANGVPTDKAGETERNEVRATLTGTLDKAAKVAGNISISDTEAGVLVQEIRKLRSSGGSEIPVADLRAAGVPNPDPVAEPKTKVNVHEAASYIVLAKGAGRTKDYITQAADQADKLGYDKAEFTAAVEAEYKDLMKGASIEDQIKKTNAFNANLQSYTTNLTTWAAALPSGGGTIDADVTRVVDALKVAVEKSAALKDAKKNGATPDVAVVDEARNSLNAVQGAYDTALANNGADKNKDLQAAIKHKIHQAIQEEVAASKAAGSGLATDWGKKGDKVDDPKAFKDLTAMLDTSVIQSSMNITPASGIGASSSIDGAGKSSDGKGLTGTTAALAGLAVAGAALTLGGMKSGGQEEVDQATGEVTKKKGFMGKVVAALGVVTTVAAILAITRGKDENGIADKLRAGLAPLTKPHGRGA
ncbi:MAG TPA: hypothetical protein VFT64_12050 [Rickettsiales bacterium]|nr:hypothetical protein [Rickettsiales bacterium]